MKLAIARNHRAADRRARRSRSPAAADQVVADSLRAETQARDGRLLGPPLRRTHLAPAAPARDRRAHGRRPAAPPPSATPSPADVPDPELHELPNVCAHFVVADSGRIFRLVNLRTRCRHTVGLNWTAIGIEHVGYGDGDVLGDRRQLRASLRLTRWLRCRFGIRVRDVIGHAESLSSPYHRERVPSLRRQTHGDWRHASMRSYRRKLRRLGPCRRRLDCGR